MRYPKGCKDYSMDELVRQIEFLNLLGEVQESKEPKPELLERIELFRKEAKFRALAQARFKYKASGRPSEQWPKALQGEPYCKWEIATMERLGLEVDENLRVQAKIWEDVTEQLISKPTV